MNSEAISTATQRAIERMAPRRQGLRNMWVSAEAMVSVIMGGKIGHCSSTIRRCNPQGPIGQRYE